MPETYITNEQYYQLLDDLNHLDPDGDKHDYLERRDEIVQALAGADVWPDYTRIYKAPECWQSEEGDEITALEESVLLEVVDDADANVVIGWCVWPHKEVFRVPSEKAASGLLSDMQLSMLGLIER